ncbi:putative N-formylglutamate amidohydrolase [Azospirillum agricola]|uniref:N-formylglutamate amidohydrolase n=1 Tax=Azospirillum agricola TaxID=1720247 RepID=UPI001AEB4194|nr:N-formylglutamate amidohydrolase [Azospirillum agricola]MBP2228040.1 putative N-formylglutamate amidohydrolase [Azospirillum agricola]
MASSFPHGAEAGQDPASPGTTPGPAAHAHPVTAPTPPRAAPPPPLLGPGDPPPATVLNADARGPLLLVCDHASRAIPRALGDLGLPEEQLCRHIAYDIGAAELTRRLAERFAAMAVLSGYSRLVVDPNRHLEDATAIPVVSDDVVIPGNRALDAAAQARRIDAIFRPYHDAVAAAVSTIRERGQVPVLLSVHSFTPAMRGVARPWHIGVLWDRDPRLPLPLLEALRADGRWVVGDNEPYSGRGTLGGTVETHATPAGYPNALLEVRQDLIATPEGVDLWARILGDALEPLLSLPSLASIRHYPRA